MRPPKGLTYGSRWIAKRGRRVTPLRVVQLYRADRRALVEYDDGERGQLTWADLRRSWRPATV